MCLLPLIIANQILNHSLKLFTVNCYTYVRIVIIYIFLVSNPIVLVTTLNTETVGQSLTLQCKVTTVRGVTSRVDIVWSSGGTVLRRANGTTAATMDNSLVYTHSYTISQLSTTDDGRVIQCEVVINTSPPKQDDDKIELDVIGKYR